MITTTVEPALGAGPTIDGPNLERAFAHGVARTAAARWAAQAVSWAATLVVARLLSPDDYGVMAMAMALHGLVTVLSEFGLGITIVTLRNLSSLQVAQFNTLSAALGAGGFAAMAALAPAIAAFFSRPDLAPVIVATGATFVLSGLRTIPSALLQRDLRFGALSAIEGTQAVAGAAATLLCARAGWGYWSLVAGMLTSAAVWTGLLLLARPTAFARPRRHTLGPALTFTRHQLTGSLAWYCYSNADFVVAGRLLGGYELGLYALAWTLARAIPERIANIALRLTPVFFAAVSGDLAALRRWILAISEGLALVCFPLVIGLSLVADDAIRIVAGSQWEAAALPLRLLAIYAAFDIVTQPLTRALVAAGDSRFTARLGIAMAIVMPAGFILGARLGPAGLALSWLILAPAVRISALARVRSRIGLTVRAYAMSLWPAASATAVMAMAVALARLGLQTHGTFERLAVSVGCGAAAYLIAMLVFHRPAVTVWVRHYQPLGPS